MKPSLRPEQRTTVADPLSWGQRRGRARWLFAGGLAACLFGLWLGLVIGPAKVGAGQVGLALLEAVGPLQRLFHASPPAEGVTAIVLNLRLPRSLLALLVGAVLGVAGAIMQALFRNPMAEPYLLGVSSGAGLGASIGFLFGLEVHIFGLSTIPVLAFAGAAGVAAFIYALGGGGRGMGMTTLLLAGIAVGSFVSAVNALLMIMMREELRGLIFWLMGGFSLRGWEEVTVMLPYVVVGLFLALFFARELNALLLGDEGAMQLGVNVERVRKILLATATLLAAAAVSVGGIIGFVGLIVPHMARPFTGANHRALLPACAILGGATLLFSDILARSVSAQEIPVGIVTAMLGTPFFLWILLAARRRRFMTW